jgi:hypothetical protein
MAPYLALMQQDAYDAVRHIATRSLTTLPPFRRDALPRNRKELLLNADGTFDAETVNRLVRARDNRRVAYFDAGDTVSDAVAAILKTEPDWSVLPAETPLRLRALLRRCLEKDPSRRLRDIGDARLELDDAIADPLPTAPVATAKSPSTSARLAWSIASLLGLALAAVGVTNLWMPRAAPAVVRFQILAPEGRFDTNIGNNGLNSGTISPDGRKLAFVLAPKLQIWIRPIDSLTATALAGSDGAAPDLFWSPDSRYVGRRERQRTYGIDYYRGPQLAGASEEMIAAGTRDQSRRFATVTASSRFVTLPSSCSS